MSIPSYQIHNVLNVFSRRLVNREKGSADAENASPRSLIRKLPMSEGKRAAVVERVAEDILKKIGSFRTAPMDENGPRAYGPSALNARRFTYNVIDKDWNKVTCSMQDIPLEGIVE